MTEPQGQSASAAGGKLVLPPGSQVLALVLAVLIVLPALIRATADFNPLPYWDSDPLTFVPAITGLTPGVSMALDLVVIFAGSASLIAGWWPRGALFRTSVLGASLVLAYWVFEGTYTDARLASAWCAGVIGAVSLAGLCREPTVKAVCAALTLSVLGLLLAKGILQWFVEHPAAVENFKRHRALILASNGWEDGGSLAKGYERRLMQREASGWFGLANVYASFAAALSVMLVMLTIAARRARRPVLGVLALATGGAFLMLLFAGSKGGLAAMLVGLVAAAALAWRPGQRRSIPIGWLGPGLCAIVMVGVAVRGLLGDQLAELSLRFRWFYWQACAGILSRGPTGPGGFQDAYLLAKPPLSPEEVQSAHNPLMDWLATLGWPGLLLAIVFGVLLVQVGTAGSHRGDALPAAESKSSRGAALRAVLVAIGLLALATVQLDRELLTEPVIVVRLGGLAAGMTLSLAVLHVALRWPGASMRALSAGALTAAVHSMIEVTGTNQQASGLWWALLGMTAANAPGSLPALRTVPWARWCTAAPLTLVILAISVRTGWVWKADATLRAAAEQCRDVAEVGNILLSAKDEPDPLRRAELRTEAAEIIRAKVPPGTPPDRAEATMRLAAIDAARVLLDEALAWTDTPWPLGGAALRTYWPIAREEQRLALLAMQLRGGPTESERKLWLPLVEAQAHRRRLTTAWSWLATVYQATDRYGMESTLSQASGMPTFGLSRPRLIEFALLSSRKLDPYNPMHLQRLLALTEAQGWPSETQRYAAELLLVDDLQRLDRETRGLSEPERRRVEALAKPPPPAP